MIDDSIFGYEKVNAADQRRDPQSLLNWMERIIRMRKERSEIGWGDWTILPTGSPHVLAIRYDWRDRTFLAVHNVDAKPHRVKLNVRNVTNLLSDDHSLESIEAFGYRWFEIA